ncbi:hypothetical protein AQUCO_02100227v1 [Aquilegia coerulea]|uniref:Uncharacterized protein n=1 Tax=Aquilegia coerulea TaxID=218851 RepID=A0A2G5DFB0_AQUCA|nr:hypothetical protein AQUCO_02100227v1 [Aquilegia coerulea]
MFCLHSYMLTCIFYVFYILVKELRTCCIQFLKCTPVQKASYFWSLFQSFPEKYNILFCIISQCNLLRIVMHHTSLLSLPLWCNVCCVFKNYNYYRTLEEMSLFSVYTN